MIKIFKLIIAVALATIIGIWATKYHGYIMLVLADKTIKMNLVAFIFISVFLFFLLVFAARLVTMIFKFPYQLFSWFMGFFSVNKQEKFVALIADIALGNNRLVNSLSVANIAKLTPKHLKDYILFRKLDAIATSKNVKELEKALKQIDSKLFTYKFFEIYKLYLVQKLSEAHTKVLVLLENKDVRFQPRIVDLAANIALSDKDDALALRVLDKYDAYLKEQSEEKLIVLALEKAKGVTKLTEIYNKADATKEISRAYLQQLVDFDEMTLAIKFAKKQFANNNISSSMLVLYVNAFGMQVSRIAEKVLNKSNHDYESILTLLDLAVVKSDNHSVKMIYDFIERNIKNFLSNNQLAKYSHILCKFYIKNGEVAGLDLSEARLVYRSN